MLTATSIRAARPPTTAPTMAPRFCDVLSELELNCGVVVEVVLVLVVLVLVVLVLVVLVLVVLVLIEGVVWLYLEEFDCTAEMSSSEQARGFG
jgi:hypothetical protein